MFFSLLFIERSLVEYRQVPLDATSDLPTLFDGTTRFIFLLIYLSFEKIFFHEIFMDWTNFPFIKYTKKNGNNKGCT